jgi:hypothetical protein
MAGNGMVVATSKTAYKRLCRGNYASSGTGPYRFPPPEKRLTYVPLQKVLIGQLNTKAASSLAARVMRGKSIRANKGGGGNGPK